MGIYYFDDHGNAFTGGKRQIQAWVNLYPDDLSESVMLSLRSLCRCGSTLTWVSPLQGNHYAEYSDQEFLKAVNLAPFVNELAAFWPKGGPIWDALAVAELDATTPKHGVVLVEAKSHIAELCGGGCQADGQDLKQIKEAFRLTRQWCGVSDRYAEQWLGTFHQIATRLAFLFFLREILRVSTWLVNIYFMDDPHHPTSMEQWNAFLPDMRWALGLNSIHSEFITEFYLCAEPEKLWVKKCRN